MNKTSKPNTEKRPETLADEALEQAHGGFSIDPNGQRVASGDRKSGIVTGAGPGGGPHVKVFDGGAGNDI
ncbi:MAG: hypothetical protein RIM84_16400 [Alphaproteobacteria bacterium]